MEYLGVLNPRLRRSLQRRNLEDFKQIVKFFGVIWLFCLEASVVNGAICSDPDVMAITSRGSVTDTPCTVPNKKGLIDGGYQYGNLTNQAILTNFPQIGITVGLPKDIEFTINPPSYSDQHRPSLSGALPAIIGAKKGIIDIENLAFALEGFMTLPGGSKTFGSDGTGATINVASLYNLNSKVSINAMIGGSSLTMPAAFGGARYNSFNYSVALSFAPVERISLFAEMFGETKTSAIASSGVDWDVGILYALNQYVVLDIEFADRFYGNIDKYQNYVGTGITVLFS